MIANLLLQHALRRPRGPWLTMLEGESLRTLTFGEAWERTQRRADTLARQGLRAEDRVALAPRNDLDSVVTMLAVLTLGAHVWMLDPDDPSDRRRRQIAARRPDLVLGEIAGATVMPADRRVPSELVPVPVSPAAPAYLFNTSGSTGVPKAVVQAHAAVVANARSFTAHHRVTRERTVLGFLPIHHVNAVHSNLMSTLLVGAECVLLRPHSLLRLHRWIETTEPYVVSLVPSAADALLTSWRRPRVPDSLSHVLSAAAPLSAQTARSFLDRIGRPIIQGYGLSETMNFSTTVPIDLDDATYAELMLDATRPSIGGALPGVEVEVRDTTGTPVEAGRVGELFIRGRHLMSGYDGDEEATAAVIVDGWFRTGDLGYHQPTTDGRTHYFLTGRTKNIAKVGGEQIALEEIENALTSVPGVHDAGCSVGADPRGAELIVAGVVSSGPLDEQMIREVLTASVPRYGLPARFVRLERIPRTPTGKIVRPELDALLRRFG